ncbi:myosin heavy chain, cardiac muscle isoform-like [Cyclopterus lumpus]|uniref:myosin heavy chain, cardiac muscle isoform-like n=1 Tax=Cyclopterus lumpus TaxID=8103 RepID=UPI00148725B7|nr:myosin heavy chain, cardiac muscle isoform-like [Cyclopterus lumpus]
MALQEGESSRAKKGVSGKGDEESDSASSMEEDSFPDEGEEHPGLYSVERIKGCLSRTKNQRILIEVHFSDLPRLFRSIRFHMANKAGKRFTEREGYRLRKIALTDYEEREIALIQQNNLITDKLAQNEFEKDILKAKNSNLQAEVEDMQDNKTILTKENQSLIANEVHLESPKKEKQKDIERLCLAVQDLHCQEGESSRAKKGVSGKGDEESDSASSMEEDSFPDEGEEHPGLYSVERIKGCLSRTKNQRILIEVHFSDLPRLFRSIRFHMANKAGKRFTEREGYRLRKIALTDYEEREIALIQQNNLITDKLAQNEFEKDILKAKNSNLQAEVEDMQDNKTILTKENQSLIANEVHLESPKKEKQKDIERLCLAVQDLHCQEGESSRAKKGVSGKGDEESDSASSMEEDSFPDEGEEHPGLYSVERIKGCLSRTKNQRILIEVHFSDLPRLFRSIRFHMANKAGKRFTEREGYRLRKIALTDYEEREIALIQQNNLITDKLAQNEFEKDILKAKNSNLQAEVEDMQDNKTILTKENQSLIANEVHLESPKKEKQKDIERLCLAVQDLHCQEGESSRAKKGVSGKGDEESDSASSMEEDSFPDEGEEHPGLYSVERIKGCLSRTKNQRILIEVHFSDLPRLFRSIRFHMANKAGKRFTEREGYRLRKIALTDYEEREIALIQQNNLITDKLAQNEFEKDILKAKNSNLQAEVEDMQDNKTILTKENQSLIANEVHLESPKKEKQKDIERLCLAVQDLHCQEGESSRAKKGVSGKGDEESDSASSMEEDSFPDEGEEHPGLYSVERIKGCLSRTKNQRILIEVHFSDLPRLFRSIRFHMANKAGKRFTEREGYRLRKIALTDYEEREIALIQQNNLITDKLAQNEFEKDILKAKNSNLQAEVEDMQDNKTILTKENQSLIANEVHLESPKKEKQKDIERLCLAVQDLHCQEGESSRAKKGVSGKGDEESDSASSMEEDSFPDEGEEHPGLYSVERIKGCLSRTKNQRILIEDYEEREIALIQQNNLITDKLAQNEFEKDILKAKNSNLQAEVEDMQDNKTILTKENQSLIANEVHLESPKKEKQKDIERLCLAVQDLHCQEGESSRAKKGVSGKGDEESDSASSMEEDSFPDEGEEHPGLYSVERIKGCLSRTKNQRILIEVHFSDLPRLFRSIRFHMANKAGKRFTEGGL